MAEAATVETTGNTTTGDSLLLSSYIALTFIIAVTAVDDTEFDRVELACPLGNIVVDDVLDEVVSDCGCWW
jgi:hypothetical protein